MLRLSHRLAVAGVLAAAGFLELNATVAGPTWAAELEPVRVSADGRSFELAESRTTFRPWGLNYDHDADGRLLEDYWHEQWDTVAADFAEMRRLGANVVRVHLQFGRFMRTAEEPQARELERLGRLLRLAERLGLYLDVTGLGCYHRRDVPAWYDALEEADRWRAQANFWTHVARCCADSPAVFCYDLMNEPVVPAGGRRDDWLGGAFAGKHFVQFIALELGDRRREQVARQWTRQLVEAIRREDPRHLITVGLVPWSVPGRGLYSGFDPRTVAKEVDFLAVHVYPERGKSGDALDTLRAMQVGCPLVVEETFPLKCSPEELETFLDEADELVAGWIGFYWGQPPEQLRPPRTIAQALTLGWLELFQRRAARYTAQPAAPPER